MGICISKRPTAAGKENQPSSRRITAFSGRSGGGNNNSTSSSSRISRIRSKREESVIHERALAAALLLHQQLQQNDGAGTGGTERFDRSISLRYPNGDGGSSKKKNHQANLPRSCSSRACSVTDPLIQPSQLVNQELKLDDLETKHFVLVHGGGFGAWCWYKNITLLEEAGYTVTAVDLTGSGIHSSDPNSITSLAEYVKPLTGFLEKVGEQDKIILVGHDFGGTCISYAMELFPSKISKAIFLAATMLTTGQSALDIFSQKEESNGLMRQAQTFVYAKGNDQSPTAIELNKSLLKELLFSHCPSKDIALASVSMRPIPFLPVLEKLSLTDMNYGSVKRYYIQTQEDNAIPIYLQESMINNSNSLPSQGGVFCLKGADHSPFFSKPQALHKIFVQIAMIP